MLRCNHVATVPPFPDPPSPPFQILCTITAMAQRSTAEFEDGGQDYFNVGASNKDLRCPIPIAEEVKWLLKPDVVAEGRDGVLCVTFNVVLVNRKQRANVEI
jgi:hypothetical protein